MHLSGALKPQGHDLLRFSKNLFRFLFGYTLDTYEVFLGSVCNGFDGVKTSICQLLYVLWMYASLLELLNKLRARDLMGFVLLDVASFPGFSSTTRR